MPIYIYKKHQKIYRKHLLYECYINVNTIINLSHFYSNIFRILNLVEGLPPDLRLFYIDEKGGMLPPNFQLFHIWDERKKEEIPLKFAPKNNPGTMCEICWEFTIQKIDQYVNFARK